MSNEIAADPEPGRGTPESAAWFCNQLAALGLSQPDLTRFMLRHGDDRKETSVRRTIGRMATGNARVSGEMRVLLTVLLELSQPAQLEHALHHSKAA